MCTRPHCCIMGVLAPAERRVPMPIKSTKKPDDAFDGMDPEELVESMVLGVTEDGECVYIHTFDDDVRALEFIEVMAAGFRADVLNGLFKRFHN